MNRPRDSVLVIGASSPVGADIVSALEGRYSVVGTHHAHPTPKTVPYDLGSDHPKTLPVDWSTLRAVVVAGGVTKLDACAGDPHGTSKINVEGTLRVLGHARSEEVLPVFLSSDAVFSGALRSDAPRPKTESAPTEPTTAYGRQKLAVEEAWSGSGVVLRLSKLIPAPSRSAGFLYDAGDRLLRGVAVRAAVDQFMNLTSTEDVARVVAFAIEQRLLGVWHVAGRPARSRYRWIASLADALDVDAELVVSCSLLDFDSPEPRPRDCTLDASALERLLPFSLRSGDDLVADTARGFSKPVSSRSTADREPG